MIFGMRALVFAYLWFAFFDNLAKSEVFKKRIIVSCSEISWQDAIKCLRGMILDRKAMLSLIERGESAFAKKYLMEARNMPCAKDLTWKALYCCLYWDICGTHKEELRVLLAELRNVDAEVQSNTGEKIRNYWDDYKI